MWFSETSMTRAPKEASVAKTELVPGMLTLPKRTAVPGGELRVSVVETLQSAETGKTDMKPVLLTVGSPLTVVMRAVSSLLKNVSATELVGPAGGVVWLRSKGRRVSMAERPVSSQNVAQAMPALAPEFATQASLCFLETARLTGNSPAVSTGLPTMVNLVGSQSSILNKERVFDPALTAKTSLPETLTAPWLPNASGTKGFPFASTSLLPAPPVAVRVPPESVPFLLIGIATMLLFASLVMK